MLRLTLSLLVAAVCGLLLLPRAAAAQDCYLSFSVYTDYYYVDDDTLAAYGSGVDYSNCQEWGHAYSLRLRVSGSVGGAYIDTSGADYADGTIDIGYTETVTVTADFKVFCFGRMYWDGPATYSQQIPVQNPNYHACGLPTGTDLINGPTANGYGWLQMTYGWSSSTGDLADLGTCSIGEELSYSPSTWPNPPWTSSPGSGDNTWVNSGVNGYADDSSIPGTLQSPYASAQVTGQQYLWFRCGCYVSGQKFYMMGPNQIDRSVAPNGSGGWKYTASKHGVTAVINPLP